MDVNSMLAAATFLVIFGAIFQWIRMSSQRPVILPISVLRNSIRLNKILAGKPTDSGL